MSDATKLFRELFNNHYNNSEENDKKNELARKRNEERLKKCTTNEKHKVGIQNIKDIIKHLNNGKSSGYSKIPGEAIKYCQNEKLPVVIQAILQRIIDFGYIPRSFNIGVITPILKDERGDTRSINNIRPITVSDVLANIFEKYILQIIEKNHQEPCQQFGFRALSSCQHSLFTFKETIRYYKEKKKPVYVALIDASKAFDKINRELLFEKLETILEKPTWSALYQYYNNSYSYVQLNNAEGEIFKTTIGVKQGGPLSPKLFSIYVEELIYRLLECTGICNINGIKSGVVMYADDLTILCESEQSLNKSLEICEKYGNEFDIKYNAEKTQYMIFGTKKQREEEPKIIMSKQTLKRAYKTKLLGREFNDRLTDDDHTTTRTTKTLGSFYKLTKIGINDKAVNSGYKSKLFKIFCRPILHYGAENIKMTKKIRSRMVRFEGGLVKRSIGLSKRSKNSELFHACKIDSTNEYIDKCKLKLTVRLIHNPLTKKIIENQIERMNRNDNKMSKDAYIVEISKIIDAKFKDIKDLHDKCIQKMKSIQNKIKENQKNDKVEEIRKYLNNPTKENIEKVGDILRPEQLKS